MSTLDVSEIGDALPNVSPPAAKAGGEDRAAQLDAIFVALDPTASDASDGRRAKAIVDLAQLVGTTSPSANPDDDIDRLKPLLLKPLVSRLSNPNPPPLAQSLALLTSIFPLSPTLAAALFADPEVQSHLLDIPDLVPSRGRGKWEEVERGLQGLLAQAAGVGEARRVLREGRWVEWLESRARKGGSGAALALVKLSRSPDPSAPPDPKEVEASQLGFARQFMAVVESQGQGVGHAIEGLALLSSLPPIKSLLSSSPSFLRALLALAPSPRSTSPTSTPLPNLYGLAAILASLTAYPPLLSSEDSQLARLRALAASGLTASSGSAKLAPPPEDPRESAEAALARCNALIAAGVLPALVSLSRVDSSGVRAEVGRSFCSLAEARPTRGLLVRDGASRALRTLLSSLPSSPSTPVSDSLLPALHALAKLTISLPPTLLFPPPSSPTDALRPLALLLLHPSSSPLQQFESLLALTNLASFPGPLPPTLAAYLGLLPALEQHLLSSPPLLRRAATELVCNLLSSAPTARTYFSAPRSRTELLLAMTDVDDLETRRAGCAGLVGLASDEEGARSILRAKGGGESGEAKVWEILLRALVPDDDDEEEEQNEDADLDLPLLHRAIVLISALLPVANYDVVVKAGVPEALVAVVRRYKDGVAVGEGEEGQRREVVRGALEGVGWFVRKGWKMQGMV